ncbi:hypothetical protein D9756_005870 [Leucocoprinus leucothites]|uniref:Uncharacterized protein n=1 Tax=Leucocoprinus leucothites TaxID=201217 RepID=A0A8H5D5Q8_9AGAR|nr:hypothetical protein D9756_005870 [Leucoagaricus leucothites]
MPHNTKSVVFTLSRADEDEFAAYDFSEFTEEDFARIDADIAKKGHLSKVNIAYETVSGQNSSHQPSSSKRGRPRLSPLEAFRRCEVQFEYGLRGKRSRPLGERPKSFRSASGKNIKTDGVVAAQNDVITSKGKAIHKALEREVKPEEVFVEVMTTEERWALRLVNMLTCLRGMRLEGFTREMPVFGMEDGEDELVYRPVHNEAPNDEQPDAADLSQTRIENYFTPSSTAKSRNTACDDTSFQLLIIDTKTRQRPSLPLEEDTLPSRLQLMLYHKLLSRLVASEPSFNFMAFWQLANVNPEQNLSWHFLEQAGLVAGEGEFQVYNLNDLSALWHDLVYQLNIAGVDDQLKLIYRLQTHGGRRKGRSNPFPFQGAPELIKTSCSSEDSLLSPAATTTTDGEIIPLSDSPAEGLLFVIYYHSMNFANVFREKELVKAQQRLDETLARNNTKYLEQKFSIMIQSFSPLMWPMFLPGGEVNGSLTVYRWGLLDDAQHVSIITIVNGGKNVPKNFGNKQA